MAIYLLANYYTPYFTPRAPSLPNEMILDVIQKLSGKELRSPFQVSHRWKGLTEVVSRDEFKKFIKSFEKVLGVQLSHTFIDSCKTRKEAKAVALSIKLQCIHWASHATPKKLGEVKKWLDKTPLPDSLRNLQVILDVAHPRVVYKSPVFSYQITTVWNLAALGEYELLECVEPRIYLLAYILFDKRERLQKITQKPVDDSLHRMVDKCCYRYNLHYRDINGLRSNERPSIVTDLLFLKTLENIDDHERLQTLRINAKHTDDLYAELLHRIRFHTHSGRKRLIQKFIQSSHKIPDLDWYDFFIQRYNDPSYRKHLVRESQDFAVVFGPIITFWYLNPKCLFLLGPILISAWIRRPARPPELLQNS